MVECDFERIEQVLSNLIGNALKFSISGQKIVFGAQEKKGEIVFFISDQGPGIPPEEQPHVFDRYWQTGNHKKAGIGLGLAICKGIIEAHGGTIGVDSEEGKGSVFWFRIPPAQAGAKEKMVS